ncbi:hypothetical protein [Bartonella sp. B41]
MVTKKRYDHTTALIDCLSYSAVKLLDIHDILSRAKKDNVGEKEDLLHQIDSIKKHLYEISHALILEYRKRQEDERFLKQILASISDHLFSLNNGFKETSRLFFQEIRVIQSQMQCFYENNEKQCLLSDQEFSYSSKINETIEWLQKARERLIVESPHLFEKEW